MRRHPDLVRAAVLDGVYPPQVNGEQNEPEIVRRAFEQLYGDCAADAVCRQRHPDLRGAVEGLIDGAERTPLDFALTLEDGPHLVRLDGTQVLMVLLNMMREGEAGSIPETVARGAARRPAAAQALRRGSRDQRRRPAGAERPAVRRALQQHRMPRDLADGRSHGAAQGDRRQRRLRAERAGRASRRPSVRCGASRRRRPRNASR